MSQTTFKPLSIKERKELQMALRDNADGDKTILTNPADTSFAGVTDGNAADEDTVVKAVRSIPSHY